MDAVTCVYAPQNRWVGLGKLCDTIYTCPICVPMHFSNWIVVVFFRSRGSETFMQGHFCSCEWDSQGWTPFCFAYVGRHIIVQNTWFTMHSIVADLYLHFCPSLSKLLSQYFPLGTRNRLKPGKIFPSLKIMIDFPHLIWCISCDSGHLCIKYSSLSKIIRMTRKPFFPHNGGSMPSSPFRPGKQVWLFTVWNDSREAYLGLAEVEVYTTPGGRRMCLYRKYILGRVAAGTLLCNPAFNKLLSCLITRP